MAKKKNRHKEDLGEYPLSRSEMERVFDKDRDEMVDAVPEVEWDEYQHDAGHEAGGGETYGRKR